MYIKNIVSKISLNRPSALILLILFGVFSFAAFDWPQAQTKRTEDKTDPRQPARLDWDEIRSAPVGFQNYSAKAAPDVMRVLDKQWGENLAREVFKSRQSNIKGLQIRRIFDPAKPGLGADIISISKKSNFGHINRLQRLIEAYLENSFNFSERDARTASRFILYYNARNRAKAEKIKKRYSQKVVASLDPQKIGIHRSYRNWAGKTELLLPLRKNIVNPQETDLNLREIRKGSGAAPKKEQGELRKTEQRRNQQELKKLDRKAKELQEEQSKNKKRNSGLGQEKKGLEQQSKTLDSRLKRLQKDPEKNAQAIKEAEAKQRELRRKQRIAAKKSKAIEQKQKENTKRQAEVSRQKKQAQSNARELASSSSSRSSASQAEPAQNKSAPNNKEKELAKLKAENERLKAEKEKNLVQDKLLFMRVVRYTRKGHYQNELWYLDANRDDTLFRSPFTKICSRNFTIIPKKGVVVTGYKGSVDTKTDHRLVLLDLKKLTKIDESKILVHWRTPLLLRNNKLYVFTQKKEKYHLARLDTNMNREAESKDPINPYSEITFYKNKIFLTGQSKAGSKTTIHVFKLQDLSTIKIIRP